MKPIRPRSVRLSLLLILPMIVMVLSGCSSTDPENQAQRPWGAPKGWETGFPSTMTEGR